MSAENTPYRFRPRFAALAFMSMSFGLVLIAAAATLSPDIVSGLVTLAFGGVGLFLGIAYLRSPVWRLSVDVGDSELVVWNGPEERLRLPWDEVVKVVANEDRSTLYVDGGSADKSLLVPGPGATASYTIKRKKELIREILEHVPSELVESPEQQER